MRILLLAAVVLVAMVGLAGEGVAPSLSCQFNLGLMFDSEGSPPASESHSDPATICAIVP